VNARMSSLRNWNWSVMDDDLLGSDKLMMEGF
jgi:hypothetical protein